MPTAEDFKLELYPMILEAMKAEKEFVEINAGQLHGRVGDYPGTNHRMAMCCKVMFQLRAGCRRRNRKTVAKRTGREFDHTVSATAPSKTVE